MAPILKYTLQFAVPILILVAVCVAIDQYLTTDAPLPIAVIGAGLIAFVFTLSNSSRGDREIFLDTGIIRSSIAVSVVMQYLVLVGLTAFIQNENRPFPQLTQTMITNFTTVVGVVVAFFFGSSAYVQTHRQAVSKNDQAGDAKKS
ncbi:MAG: hypothetical protein JOY71_20165 [Acetobacteraceae bacterium]|nr:hypothetical protein [Acetobacteraceae bacterium]